jgi:hypothetical protein
MAMILLLPSKIRIEHDERPCGLADRQMVSTLWKKMGSPLPDLAANRRMFDCEGHPALLLPNRDESLSGPAQILKWIKRTFAGGLPLSVDAATSTSVGSRSPASPGPCSN